jgi:DNA-binding transcriptional ArsR family regulator
VFSLISVFRNYQLKSEQLQCQLTRTFAALADPTRRAVLSRLITGEATVGELARGIRISAPSFSRHLKVLESAGLIAREHDAQWRRCRIQPQALRTAFDWLKNYDQIWDDQLNKLSAYVDKLNAGNNARGPHGKRRASPRR